MDKNKLYTIDIILGIIEKQFKDLINNDQPTYSGIKVKILNEQYYSPDNDRYEPNLIYIVVKFLESSINFGQNIVSFTMNAISEENKINLTQKLLLDYVQVYNLEEDIDYPIGREQVNYNQAYGTPVNTSAFNDMYAGYRSLFLVSGTMLISYNMNDFDVYWYDGETKIEVDALTSSIDYNVSIDSQPYSEGNLPNFTTSVHQFATMTLTFSVYLTKEALYEKILDLMNNNAKANNSFEFELVFKDGLSKISKRVFRLVNCSISKSAGQMPMAALTFTN